MSFPSKPVSLTRSAVLDSTVSRRSRLSDYFEMTKPRLSFLSVISAVVGYLAATPALDLPLFLSLLFGTALAAGGAAVLNEYMEREEDGLMRRTASRPIPAGQIEPLRALLYGLALACSGTAMVWIGANPTAGALTALTLLSYLLLYTPLKKRSPWAAEVGAVPGALPPLIGWTAATQSFHPLGWYLFGIMFAWQMTHFLAISWNCREDYKRGGFLTLSVLDPSGARVARHAFLYALLLTTIALLPIFVGGTGLLYATLAPLVSMWFLWEAARFWWRGASTGGARRLFFASIIHLPIFLLVLVVDRFLF